MTQKLTPTLSLALLFVPMAASHAQVAFSTDFPNEESYTGNFVTMPSSSATLAWQSDGEGGGYLLKTGAGTQSVIFDTSATGGSGGSRADNAYTNVAVSSLYQQNIYGLSMSTWAHVSDNYRSGYLGYFSLSSSSSALLRIYDSNSDPYANTVGTVLASETVTGLSLSTNTDYLVELIVENDGASAVDFTLTLWDFTHTTSIASVTATDTTSPVLQGQVGLRLSSQTIQYSEFSVSPIPEPAATAAIAATLVVLVYVCRRKALGC